MFTSHPQGHFDVIEIRANLRVIDQLEVSAGHASETEARRRQQITEQITLGLIEPRQLFHVFRVLGHEVSQRVLQWCHTAEAHVLVNLAQFRCQCRWRDHVAGFPARNVIGLAERADHESALVQLFMVQHADVGHAVEHQVFVDFVADQIDIAITDQIRQLIQLGTADQCATRIVRCVQHNHPRARRDGLGQFLEVDRKVIQPQLHMHTTATGQFHRRLVTVVARIENDHFVAAVDNRLNRAEDRLGGAGSDGHFVVRIDSDAVAASNFRRHLLTQCRQAGHR
ncbi:hypothetical protein D3C87_1404640 [compost metagenome]